MPDVITCSQCLMPIDPDQIGEIDEDREVICLDCLEADPDTE